MSDRDYVYVMHKQASKQLSKLPESVDDRIQSKLKEMVENEWRDLSDFDVKQIASSEFNIYRTRIGGYRVIFVIEHLNGQSIVGILHVDKREGVYGNVQRLIDRARDFFD